MALTSVISQAEAANSAFDYLFKILLVGDSGVGKSSLLLRFTSDEFSESTSPTIGVDFRLKYVSLQDHRIKLTIWDTAGQERFRTLTSSYYRGAQGIIFAYDVTRKETLDSIDEIWMKEVDMYSTVDGAVKAVIGTKVDVASSREVSKEEGQALARKYGCLFAETSAKANLAVDQAFEELVLKILETPQLLDNFAATGNVQMGRQSTQSSSCCG